jgi:hypothetical protein
MSDCSSLSDSTLYFLSGVSPLSLCVTLSLSLCPLGVSVSQVPGVGRAAQGIKGAYFNVSNGLIFSFAVGCSTCSISTSICACTRIVAPLLVLHAVHLGCVLVTDPRSTFHHAHHAPFVELSVSLSLVPFCAQTSLHFPPRPSRAVCGTLCLSVSLCLFCNIYIFSHACNRVSFNQARKEFQSNTQPGANVFLFCLPPPPPAPSPAPIVPPHSPPLPAPIVSSDLPAHTS